MVEEMGGVAPCQLSDDESAPVSRCCEAVHGDAVRGARDRVERDAALDELTEVMSSF